MEYMKTLHDKHFNLAIVDPPYGIGASDYSRGGTQYGNSKAVCKQYERKVWDKDNGDNGYADCELAWTSFQSAVRKVKYTWHGMIQQNMKDKEMRIHPTQKPVALYEWLLRNYAKPGDKILDTHLGSGSSRIAAYNLCFDFVGCEIDEDYFKAQEERFKAHTAQGNLFVADGLTYEDMPMGAKYD